MAAPQVVLVTGGNSGIGYEVVKALLESDRPYHVLLGSRSLEKGQRAIETLQQEVPASRNKVEAVQLDLTSDESIEKAFNKVKASPGRLDVLVNNAGAAHDVDYLKGVYSLRDCFNKAYDVNVTGTTIVTTTFAPLLIQSSDPRLIFISGLSSINQASEAYFPTPPQPAGWPKSGIKFETIGYRCSKTALSMLMLDWNHKLKEDGVKVWAVNPGILETDLGNMRGIAKALGAAHPSAGGKLLRGVIEGERDDLTGKLIGKDGVQRF